jgi:peptidoglycan/xylan/chitin deacetylase (PgdA/CDA1 family)
VRLVTLEYHDLIVDDAPDASGFPGASAASYKLSDDEFVRHLHALSPRGGVGGEIRTVLQAKHATSRPPVVLTFDDGGASAMRIADHLDQFGWCGHFFIASDCLGRSGFLSEKQARDLHTRGHVVGSHSRTHPLRMAACPTEMIAEEWRVSVDRLASALGAPAPVASVPGGYFSREVAELAAAAGIRVLFTSEPSTRLATVDGCTVIGRFTVRRWTSATNTRALVDTWPAARASQWMSWTAKKVVKAAAGGAYLRARERMFGE